MITELPQPCDSTRHHPISSDPESSEDEDTDESSELEQVFLNISELITSLYRLSKSIRNPTVTKRRMKASRLDISAFEKYDIEHARQKFPSAPAYLTSRLGKANSRRRAWLSYNESHAVKLRQPLDASDTLSETTATSFQSKKYLESRGEDTMDDSTSSMSETSYASSAGGFSTARMPSMPNEAKNEELFECPYCHAIECVKSSHAWKKHVYSDLQPYVCTFEACSLSTENYGSRHAWFNHELQIHRRSWTCKEHCSKKFTTEDSMVTHILKYNLALTRPAALILASMCINSIGEVVENKCPLCDVITTGISQLRKHLGRHLEELALFALGVVNADSDVEDDLTASSNEFNEDLKMRANEENDKHGQKNRSDIGSSSPGLGLSERRKMKPSLGDPVLVAYMANNNCSDIERKPTWVCCNCRRCEETEWEVTCLQCGHERCSFCRRSFEGHDKLESFK